MQTNSSLPIVGYTKTLFLLSKEGGSVAWIGGSRLARHKNRTMNISPMPVGTAGIGRFFSKLNYGDFVNPINRNAKTIDKSNTIWYNGIQYQMVDMYTRSIDTKVRSD